MKKRREKDYWEKRTERYSNAGVAQARAGSLRLHEHVSHVTVRACADGFEVSFSVAKWYLEELHKAGGKL